MELGWITRMAVKQFRIFADAAFVTRLARAWLVGSGCMRCGVGCLKMILGRVGTYARVWRMSRSGLIDLDSRVGRRIGVGELGGIGS